MNEENRTPKNVLRTFNDALKSDNVPQAKSCCHSVVIVVDRGLTRAER